MRRHHGYAAATLLALAMAGATAATSPAEFRAAAVMQANLSDNAILKGTIRGLRFLVYPPAQTLPVGQARADELRVSVPGTVRLLGARWDGRNIVVSYRGNLLLNDVYRHHSNDLSAQGFKRRGDIPRIASGTSNLSVSFERANDVIELRLNRTSDGHRVMLDLAGVREGNTE